MRKHSSGVTILAAIVLVAVAMAAPVSAHHGWSEYHDEQFEITGDARDGRQPRRAACDGADQSRRQAVGHRAGPRPPRTASAGLTEDVIPVGATVTASGHRHLDEATLEVKTERLTGKYQR